MEPLAISHTLEANGIRVATKTTDEGTDGIKLTVPKKVDPELEIRAILCDESVRAQALSHKLRRQNVDSL
jgi:hypothetical protein